MKPESKYIWTVAMDVAPEKEDLFNELYESEHIPNLLNVPGIEKATRYRVVRGTDGSTSTSFQKYFTTYEMQNKEVWGSPEFIKYARHAGSWPQLVRPYTSNRRHILYEKISED